MKKDDNKRDVSEISLSPTYKRRREDVRKPKSLSKKTAIVLACILALLVGYLASRGWVWYQLRQEMIHVQQEEQRLQEEHRQLEAEKAKYTDPAQIEKEARDQLGLVKEKEVPYIR